MKVKVLKTLRNYAFDYRVQRTLKVGDVIEIPKGRVLDGLLQGKFVEEDKSNSKLTYAFDSKGKEIKK